MDDLLQVDKDMKKKPRDGDDCAMVTLLQPAPSTYKQQTRGIGPMMGWCWASVVDDAPTSAQQ